MRARRRPTRQLARVPLVGMVSYSLIFRRGPERFLDEAAGRAGSRGVIVPDLPVEEADEFSALAAERDFKLDPARDADDAARAGRADRGSYRPGSSTS